MTEDIRLLIGAGHAIFENDKWNGIETEKFDQNDITDAIELQIKMGCELLGGEYTHVVFSGGHTRPQNKPNLKNSEAEGMKIFAESKGWLPAGKEIILESYARDSFENIFYSLLAFYKVHKTWPSRVGVISMPHKSIRYMLMAHGLGIDPKRFKFHGIGAVTPLDANCINEMKNMDKVIHVATGKIVDPLLRNEYFEEKRIKRTPCEDRENRTYIEKVKTQYGGDVSKGELTAGDKAIRKLIDAVSQCEAKVSWENLKWPWKTLANE